jgi:hypothetical protein
MRKILIGLLFIFLGYILLAIDLSQEQLWAIALTGIVSERNGSNKNTLNSLTINDNNRSIWLEVLRSQWGINNRNDLLERLDYMENDVHASSLKLIQVIISEEIISVKMGDEENIVVNTKNKNYQLGKRQYNSLLFTINNWDDFKNRSNLAWIYGNNIELCRWGYNVGFLTEKEAWEKIMYYANIIKLLYNSWEEYGYDYYMGGVFWASGYKIDEKYKTENNTSEYTKFELKNGKYDFKGNIRLYKGCEYAKNTFSILENDFNENGNNYLTNKLKTNLYIEEIKKILPSETASDIDLDYYLKTFYEFSINKLNYNLNGEFGKFSHIIMGGYGENKSPIVYNEEEYKESGGNINLEIIKGYSYIGAIIGYEFFTDGNDSVIFFNENENKVLSVNCYS